MYFVKGHFRIFSEKTAFPARAGLKIVSEL